MKRVFSGIQPSGEIHLGNYLGAIQNWVRLLDEPAYESIFCIVDYHAQSISYDASQMPLRIHNAAVANVAAGLDPARCILFVQSAVPEVTELSWIFSCVTPLGELERMTQFKSKSEQHQSNSNLGLLAYPVLQAADILLYKATLVPVGEDQIQHLELSREVARKFNAAFGPVFPEPQPLLTPTARVMGLDGKTKMSKSMNNTIGLLESPDEVAKKLARTVTDENRKVRSDPGNPDICNVYTMHRGFSSADELSMIDRECRVAGIGCVDCKKILGTNIEKKTGPMRAQAAAMEAQAGRIEAVLAEGGARCRKIARDTMDEVRAVSGLAPMTAEILGRLEAGIPGWLAPDDPEGELALKRALAKSDPKEFARASRKLEDTYTGFKHVASWRERAGKPSS